jgi:capsular polysaccharide biosynthesis protein
LRSISKYQSSIETEAQPRTLDEPDLATALALATGAPRTNRPAGFQSLGRSAMTHSVLVAAAAILGLAAGAGAGYEHPPSYSAEVQLIVGRTAELAENQIPGLAAAVQNLASNYSRLITSSNVVSGTESALHTTSLPGSLTASPVPESSVINVIASSPTQAQALSLANAGATALVTVVTNLTNDSQGQLEPLVAAYQRADSLAEKATAQANFYQAQLDALLAKSSSPSPSTQAQEQSLNAKIAQWQTQADLQRLQANAYMNQYNSSLSPLDTQQEMVQVVGSAVYTGSNRTAYTEAGALGGAVGGLVIGLAGAALIDTRRGRASRAARAR